MSAYIFISGAQSTGKTTLIEKVAPLLKAKIIAETARDIIVKHGWTHEDINPKNHPEIYEKFEHEITIEKAKQLKEVESENGLFIVDRGIDALVYTKFHLGPAAYNRLLVVDELQYTVEKMKNGLTFVVLPHRECLKSEFCRLPASMAELNDLTACMCQVFDRLSIRYQLLPMLDFDSRAEAIMEKLKKI